MGTDADAPDPQAAAPFDATAPLSATPAIPLVVTVPVPVTRQTQTESDTPGASPAKGGTPPASQDAAALGGSSAQPATSIDPSSPVELWAATGAGRSQATPDTPLVNDKTSATAVDPEAETLSDATVLMSAAPAIGLVVTAPVPAARQTQIGSDTPGTSSGTPPRSQDALSAAGSGPLATGESSAIAARSPASAASTAVGARSTVAVLPDLPPDGSAPAAVPVLRAETEAPVTVPPASLISALATRVAVAVAPAKAASPNPMPGRFETAATVLRPGSLPESTEEATGLSTVEPVPAATPPTAAAVAAPPIKAAGAADLGKAAAVDLGSPVVAAAASGSHGPSQDGAAGQGRGEGRPPSPPIRHGSAVTKPFAAVAPAASPSLAEPGAPGSATSQVLQLFSSLGLTSASDAGTAADGSASLTPASTTPATARPSSVPDTVTLQLAPEALGRITVTLRLRGQALDVRLVADKQATLESLGHDRHRLEAALGLPANALDIAIAAAPQAGGTGAEGATPRGTSASNNATSDQGHGRSRNRSQEAASSKGNGDGTATAASDGPAERRDGSLYL